MADRTLELKIQARDETRAAMTSSAEGADRARQSYEKLERQVQRLRRTRAQSRVRADDQLDRQRVQMLEREAQAGNEAAGVEMRRIQITQRFKRERRDLLRIARNEQLTDQQRMRAKQQLAQLQQQHTRELSRANQVQRQTGASAMSTAQAVRRMVGAWVGMAGVRMIAGDAIRQIQTMRDAVLEFDQELRQLSSLGDNVNQMPRIRREVLDMSAAWGHSRRAVTDAMFAITSATSNLDDVTRNELMQSVLELTNVYGGELSENVQLVVKNFQIARDQGESVADVMGILAMTSERGNLRLQDLARFMPNVASAADAVGGSFREAAAAVEIATQRGGEISVTMTGVRNVFMELQEAQKKGIELNGSLVDQLRQVRDLVDSGEIQLSDLFGRETIAAANNMVNAVDDIAAALERMQQGLPDVGEMLTDRLTDEVSRLAELMNQLKQMRENMDVDPSLMPQIADWQYHSYGVSRNLHPALRGGNFESATAVAAGAVGSADFTLDAQMQQVMMLMEAGRHELIEPLLKQMEEALEGAWLETDFTGEIPAFIEQTRGLLEMEEQLREARKEATEAAREEARELAQQNAARREQMARMAARVIDPVLSPEMRRAGADLFRHFRTDAEDRAAGAGLLGDAERQAEMDRLRRAAGAGDLEARIAVEQAKVDDEVRRQRDRLEPLLSGEQGTRVQQAQARQFMDAFIEAMDERRVEIAESMRAEQDETEQDEARSAEERRIAAQRQAEEALQSQRLDTLRRLGQLGDEQAAAEARRLEVEQQFADQRRRLADIAEDEQIAAEDRVRALAAVAGLDDVRERVLAEMGQPRDEGPGTQGGPLLEREAVERLAFRRTLDRPTRDPAAETSEHTRNAARTLETMMGQMNDLIEAVREGGTDNAVQMFRGEG